MLPVNIVLACMYIGQSNKKCFKFSWAAPHRQEINQNCATYSMGMSLMLHVERLRQFGCSCSRLYIIPKSGCVEYTCENK